MRIFKRVLALLLALLMSLSMLAGCSKLESKLWETAAPLLVQGNMELLYLGTCSDEYLSLVKSTKEDAQPYYTENMEMQAGALMYVFEVYDDGQQTDRFVEILKQVCAQVRFTVGQATQVDDTHFLVDVTVEPLDFIQQVYENLDIGLADFYQSYGGLTEEDFNAMSDSEYLAYEAAWADGIYECCLLALEELRYLAPTSIQMAVSKTDTEEGRWAIDDNSIMEFDTAVLYYPEVFE